MSRPERPTATNPGQRFGQNKTKTMPPRKGKSNKPMSSNMLLPLQGGNKITIRNPRALPWAKCSLAFQAVLFFSFFLCIASCSTIKDIDIQYPPLWKDAEVAVFDIGDTIPENAEVLGGIAILGGYEARDWNHLLKKAKKEVRAIGGNGLVIQTHVYPYSGRGRFHQLSGYIIDINNTIAPTTSNITHDQAFNDYVVMSKTDTIPCLVTEETDNSILFVYGFDRQGHKRSILIPKKELISYHIEAPLSLAETQKEREKNNSVRLAIDGGYAFSHMTSGFFTNVNTPNLKGLSWACKASFVSPKNALMSVTYDHLYGIEKHYGFLQSKFIAGGIGFHLPLHKRQDLLGYYLDGLCIPHKSKQWISVEFLAGYMTSSDKDNHSKTSFGGGVAITYDILFTEHFGVYARASQYLGVLNRSCINAGICYYL